MRVNTIRLSCNKVHELSLYVAIPAKKCVNVYANLLMQVAFHLLVLMLVLMVDQHCHESSLFIFPQLLPKVALRVKLPQEPSSPPALHAMGPAYKTQPMLVTSDTGVFFCRVEFQLKTKVNSQKLSV